MVASSETINVITSSEICRSPICLFPVNRIAKTSKRYINVVLISTVAIKPHRLFAYIIFKNEEKYTQNIKKFTKTIDKLLLLLYNKIPRHIKPRSFSKTFKKIKKISKKVLTKEE